MERRLGTDPANAMDAEDVGPVCVANLGGTLCPEVAVF